MSRMSNSDFGGVRIARPLSRPPTSRYLIAACGLLLACGEPDSATATQAYTWSRDTIEAQPEFLRDLADTAKRSGTMGRPRFVRATAGLTFVSDVSEDRIAVLDSLANVVRWIGARGRGPGELFGVGHLETRGRRLFVAEALNGRVSEFTFDGKFVRTFSSPFAAGSLGATSRQTLAIARSATHYALRLDARGGGSNALRRPPLSARDRRSRWSVLVGHDLLAADSSRWWVLDQGTGDVCVYDEPRATAQCRSLPADLRARLGAYRDHRVAVLEASIPQRVSAAPLVKDMVRTSRWLAMLLPLPELPLVLLDVNDGTLTPVVFRSQPIPLWIRAATSAAWDGHGFVVVSDEGIGRLRLIRSTFH